MAHAKHIGAFLSIMQQTFIYLEKISSRHILSDIGLRIIIEATV